MMKAVFFILLLVNGFVNSYSLCSDSYVIHLKYENLLWHEGGEVYIFLEDFDKDKFQIIDTLPSFSIVQQFIVNNYSILEINLELEAELCCKFGDINEGYKRMSEGERIDSVVGKISLNEKMSFAKEFNIKANEHEVYYFRIVKVKLEACKCQRVIFNALDYNSDKVHYLKNIISVEKLHKKERDLFKKLLCDLLN